MTNRLHAALASLAALLVSLVAVPAHAGQSPEEKALARAIKLLPERPGVPVRFIDPELAADADAIRRVDAFLVRETTGKVRQAIYLNRRSSVVEDAIRGKDIGVAILAAVLRHELEHLRGADEPGARKAERDFFQGLIFTGKVPSEEGLAYLHDLTHAYRIREG